MAGMTPELFIAVATRLASLADTLTSIDAPLRAEVDGLKADALATGDIALIHGLFPARSTFADTLTGDALCRSLLYRQILNLTGPIRDTLLPGVVDPATFAVYFNTGPGGPYNCLLPEGFAALYQLVAGISLRPADIATKTGIALGKRSATGRFTPGTSIDETLYAGTVPVAVTTGSTFTASQSGGAGLLTVNGDARDSAGNIHDGSEFTGRLAGDGSVTLTPTDAGDRLLNVSSITLPPNMTAGTVVIQSA